MFFNATLVNNGKKLFLSIFEKSCFMLLLSSKTNIRLKETYFSLEQYNIEVNSKVSHE